MSISFSNMTDRQLLTASATMATGLAALPPTSGVPVAMVTDYQQEQTVYANGLAAVLDKTTRTPIAIITKNEARKSLVTLTSQVVSVVNGLPDITDQQKASLGIAPRKKPTRRPVPSASPTIKVVSQMNNTVEMLVGDLGSGKRASMPKDVIGINLFHATGEQPPAQASGWTFEGGFAANKVAVTFDPSIPAGTKVWICAFYFNARKESGPASSPICVALAGSTPLPSFGQMKMAA